MLHWAVRYNGNKGYITWLLKGALTEKLYTDAALTPVCYHTTPLETSWSERLVWRCVYMHAGLYRFLIAPLADRYPVIPTWYSPAQWSTGAQRNMLDGWSISCSVVIYKNGGRMIEPSPPFSSGADACCSLLFMLHPEDQTYTEKPFLTLEESALDCIFSKVSCLD